jgi:hypothetical protein
VRASGAEIRSIKRTQTAISAARKPPDALPFRVLRSKKSIRGFGEFREDLKRGKYREITEPCVLKTLCARGNGDNCNTLAFLIEASNSEALQSGTGQFSQR